MSKQYRQLDDLQTRLGIDRWHKVLGDSVWDDLQVKEIPVEDAAIIARGLARGNRGENRSIANTAEYRELPKKSDAIAIESMNKGITRAYEGINNINTPSTAYVGNG